VPQFAVNPDDLHAAASLARGDVTVWEGAARALEVVAGASPSAVPPTAPSLREALEAYLHVEMVAAGALAEATAVLSGGFATGAARYTGSETGIAAELAGAPR
jgi:hypothetical protein